MRCVECGQYKDSQGHALGCWTTDPVRILPMMTSVLEESPYGLSIDELYDIFAHVETCDIAATVAYGVNEEVLKVGWDFRVELNELR